MKDAIVKNEELDKEIKGSVIPSHYVNPANPKTHKEITKLENLCWVIVTPSCFEKLLSFYTSVQQLNGRTVLKTFSFYEE